MSGFVYIWYDRKHKRYYVGSHWGAEDDGYVCSSNWMKQAYKHRPEDFKRRIISRIDAGREDLLIEEQRWLQMMKPEEMKGPRYYNLTNRAAHWHAQDDEKLRTVKEKLCASWTPERKERMREIMRNRHVSEETRAKLSAKLMGRETYERTEEHRRMAAENSRRAVADGRITLARGAMRGRKHSEEAKEKIRSHRHTDEAKARIGAASSRKKSPETRQRMREAALRRVERNGGVAVVVRD